MKRDIEKKQSKTCHWNKGVYPCKLVVEYGMTYLTGNAQPYFSITASEYRGSRMEACGCMHDEIAEKFPELAELIQYHLCDQDGLPMHYVANAKYWATKGDYDTLRRHIRLQEDESYPYDFINSENFEQWLESRKSQLKQDFDAAMAKFGVEYIDVSQYA